ncbi:MAG: hypothetical protein EZS26_002664 [Candidatus Ordinivivax streblomastigis]|uniref:Outer membrane protein n=1 Tax=Candidatus Ordinivivax streblomastigis TaxID=2540710 RepID=A0A5M8NWZ7_9BACT|nr:MAG: hypothetical protein EZS26_002664 [Candidatus Ordinivivax streblomastigis]
MIKKIWIWFLLVCFAGNAAAQDKHPDADSIMLEVLKYRDWYGDYIREYNALVYIKGNTQVKKKNILSKYAPNYLYWDQKGDDSFIESMVKVHYASPNYFTQEIMALNGDHLRAEDVQDRLMRFLNVNIYNSTMFNDQILMPEHKKVFKYYRFKYIASQDTLGQIIHQIQIIPKIKSQKLISGYFYIVDGSWTIYRFDIRGKWEFFKFRVETELGLYQKEFLLPHRSTITFHLNLLGNEMVNTYFSQFEYQSVNSYDKHQKPAGTNYDLSHYFSIETDSVPVVADTLFWEKQRPVPLSPHEDRLLDNNLNESQTTGSPKQSWYIAKGLTVPTNFEHNQMQYNYSGLLNPLKLAYSDWDGVVYWQQISMKKTFGDGKMLRFNPAAGFLFQEKKLYFSTPATWVFAPAKFGEFFWTFENRNQAYNSTTIQEIKQFLPDSINFNDLQLKYYQHYHTYMEAKYEISNGFLVYGGLYYDWYIPVLDKLSKDATQLVEDRYRSFAPVIGLRWTPRQYYRFNGKQKEYLFSHYPTFMVEYARGISGVLKSNSYYERVEMNIQQKIPLNLLKSLHYTLAAGWFTNTESVYFADFKHFQRKNIPQSWSDPSGGTFYLLNSNWYNATDYYAQAHFMYESPFDLLRLFSKIPADIVSSRFYAGYLYMPVLPPYVELGYGVGNFVGNANVFVSFKRGKPEAIGLKFAFELNL